jgi:pimeloyl-ACP methyl ester carboxylesterase
MSEAAGTDDIPADVAALDARARRIETPCGDGTMVWRVWGEGDPVVLGHGAQGSWTHWIRNIGALAERHMVIAADLPGHGDSAMPATPGQAGISRAIAAGLREILGEALPVTLVGFSFGGVAFTFTAALHPDVAKRVILVGCGGLDTPIGHVELKRASGLQGEERRAVLKHNLLVLMLHDESSVDDFAIWQLATNARRARLEVPGLVLPDRLTFILPDVTAPVDAIWGEFDGPHPDPPVQEDVLRRFKPDADFRVIAGAGHWAMYERPEAFNATLLDMLDLPLRKVA